ncbi:MAG: adenylate/guanylate cyclase domain-containing protein [Chitinophagaceae bacterium]
MPKKLLYFRLRTLITISMIWMIFGIVFYENLLKPSNDLRVNVSITQFTFTFWIIGLIITATTIFFLKPAFNHQPVWFATVLKLLITVFLFFIITFLILTVYYVFRYHRDLDSFINSFFTKIVQTRTFKVFIVDMGLMTLLSIMLLEVTETYGPGMFWSMLSGEYNKPKKEKRIFVFLDLNNSTTIAEQIGHERYFRLLRTFYADITLPVLANDGEVYQYVGDEIVLSWRNTPENKAKSLKFIRNAYFLIQRRSKFYMRKYGVVPGFKAGLHAGEVTAGFVGLIKRELIYCGDTLNTTARIRSLCNELNETYILSDDFVQDFETPHGYTVENIGTTELRGKTEPVNIYSVNFE